MAVTEGGSGSGLQQRVKNILFSPAEEWVRIIPERATAKGLYTGYACILAVIGPIAQLIGDQVFGHRGFVGVVRPPLVRSIMAAVGEYVLSLGGVFLLALAIDAMAPSFGAVRSRIQALKVAVYSWTAAWIFSIFLMVPQVSGLTVIGIYSLYLLYLGVPTVMKPQEGKATVFAVLSIVAALAIWVLVTIMTDAIVGGAGAV